MKKLLKIVAIIFGALVFIFALLLIKPWVFLPHDPASISLPFGSENDADAGLIPMGEIEQWHNASTGLPDGHPGIDFQWDREVEIIAAGDGTITYVYKNDEGEYIVEQEFDNYYRTMYQELNRLEPNIQPSAEIKKGQIIGYTGYPSDYSKPPEPSDPSRQLHWDFASTSILGSRLCPMKHFDEDSRKRIEAIWARVKERGNYKKEYPNICNGAYEEED